MSTIVDTMSTTVDTESTTVDTASTIEDKESTLVDTMSTIVDTESTVREKEIPKPAQDKASTAPTDLEQLSSDLLPIEERKDCLNKDKPQAGLVNPEPALVGLRDPEPAAIDVAKILAETKQKLWEAVERQRSFRGAHSDRAPSNSRGYGGHEEHYRWRVRGGGLQPLAGVLQQMANTLPSRYHRGVPPFPRGIP